MTAGKVSNYDSEQDHQPERGSRLYGIFSKNVFFFLDNFQEWKEKRIFVLRQTKKVLSFFFPGGYSCNTRFFYTWKERLPGFGKPQRLLVIFVF